MERLASLHWRSIKNISPLPTACIFGRFPVTNRALPIRACSICYLREEIKEGFSLYFLKKSASKNVADPPGTVYDVEACWGPLNYINSVMHAICVDHRVKELFWPMYNFVTRRARAVIEVSFDRAKVVGISK